MKEFPLKHWFAPFIFIVPLFGLVSCGQKVNTAEVKVSSGFALGASGYTGGLVVSGRSLLTGQRFVKSTLGGSAVKVVLPDGPWELSVVGWDGATMYTGTPYCGKNVVEMTPDTDKVDINVTNANCLTDVYSGTGYTTSNGATPPVYSINSLKIVTCGAFYDYTAANTFTRVTAASSTASNFCNSSYVPSDIVSRVKGISIDLLNKEFDGDYGVVTQGTCITANTVNGVGVLSSSQFPIKNLPTHMTFYLDSTCRNKINQISFPDGLLPGVAGTDVLFDHKSESAINYNRVFVPDNHLRRAYSPFYSLMPDFKCAGAFCVNQPGSVPANTFYLMTGAIDYQEIKIAEEGTTCDQLVSVTLPAGLVKPATNYCVQRDDGIYLLIKESAAASCSSNCSFSYVVNYSGTQATTSATANSYSSYLPDINLYNTLWRMIGNNDAPKVLFDYYNQGDRKFGALSNVREMLGPGGAGGLFSDISTCSSASGVRDVTFFDRDSYETYQVDIGPSSKLVPYYLCDATTSASSSNATTCSSATFDKRIVIRKLNGPSYEAVAEFNVNCSNKIGMAEEQDVDTTLTGFRVEKNVVGWNSVNDVNSRFDKISYQKEVASDGTILNQNSNFERAEKISSTSFRAESFHFDSRLNASVFNENLVQKEYYFDNTNINTISRYLSLQTSNSASIFDLSYFTKSFYTPSLIKDSSIAVNASGDMMRVWVTPTSDAGYTNNRIYVSKYTASNNTWSHPAASGFISGNGNIEASSPRVALDDNGDAVVVWIESSTAYKKTYVNGVWGAKTQVSIGSGSYGGNTSSVSTCISNGKAAIVWAQTDTFVARDRIFVSFIDDLRNHSWSSPTNADTQGLSSSAFVSSNPKCAIRSDGIAVISWVQSSSDIYATFAAIPSTFTLTTFLSNIALAAPTSVDSSLAVKSDDTVVLSYYDSSYNAFAKTFNGTTWTALGALSGKFNPKDTYCRAKSASIGTSTACPDLSGVTAPSFNNTQGVNNLGLFELKPSRILNIFTPEASFKAK